MSDETTDQPHVDESHMSDALSNLANAITSDATNLKKLTM